MIAREQYLHALETIDLYHRQSMKIDNDLPDKTRIKDWKHLASCSVRLYNILIGAVYLETKGRYDEFQTFKGWEYIEDINKEMFYKVRNAGKKTWAEFYVLRGY